MTLARSPARAFLSTNLAKTTTAAILGALLILAYTQRGALGPTAFLGVAIVLALVLFLSALQWVRQPFGKVTEDERTDAIAGKAARATLLLFFGLAALIFIYMTSTNTLLNAPGVLAVLVAVLATAYQGLVWYFETR